MSRFEDSQSFHLAERLAAKRPLKSTKRGTAKSAAAGVARGAAFGAFVLDGEAALWSATGSNIGRKRFKTS